MIRSIKQSILTLLFSLILYTGFGQKFDFVKIIAGKGIVFNNDSILIGKTNIKETCQILGIKDPINYDELTIVDWSGFDPVTFEDTSGIEYVREINYKSMVFEYSSEENKDNLKVQIIKIALDKRLKVYTDTGIEMSEINPNISSIYPCMTVYDYVSDNMLTYCLYTHGISFQLENTSELNQKLVEISVHYILK